MENNPAAPRPSYCPEPAFVIWHVREVFQGEARYGAVAMFPK